MARFVLKSSGGGQDFYATKAEAEKALKEVAEIMETQGRKGARLWIEEA